MDYGTSPINEIAAYVINRVEYPYIRERAHQNEARDKKTRMNFSITANYLTPAYTLADS
jgi:hypothetical protein